MGDSFLCDLCNRDFKRAQLLQKHIETVHSLRLKKLVCPLWPQCQYIKNTNGMYANAANLKVHFEKHHKQYVLDFNQVESKYISSTCLILNFLNKSQFNKLFIVDPNFVAGPNGDYYDFCDDDTNPDRSIGPNNENFGFVTDDEDIVVNETELLDDGFDHLQSSADREDTNPNRSIGPNNSFSDDEEIIVNETDQLNDASVALAPNKSDNSVASPVANPNKRVCELQLKLDLANVEIESLKKQVETYTQHSKNANGSEIQLQRINDRYTKYHDRAEKKIRELKTKNTGLVSSIVQLENEIRLLITDAHLSNADNDDRLTKAGEQLQEANEKIAKSNVEQGSAI